MLQDTSPSLAEKLGPPLAVVPVLVSIFGILVLCILAPLHADQHMQRTNMEHDVLLWPGERFELRCSLDTLIFYRQDRINVNCGYKRHWIDTSRTRSVTFDCFHWKSTPAIDDRLTRKVCTEWVKQRIRDDDV
jgi:hypothetical protein